VSYIVEIEGKCKDEDGCPRGRETRKASGETISINHHPIDPFTLNLDSVMNFPNGASITRKLARDRSRKGEN
jgi:hypothetical protein